MTLTTSGINVARALDEHAVADADVLAIDLVLVMQSRASDRSRHPGERRNHRTESGTGAAAWTMMSSIVVVSWPEGI